MDSIHVGFLGPITIPLSQKGQACKADRRDWIAVAVAKEEDAAKRCRVIQLGCLLAPGLTPYDPGH